LKHFCQYLKVKSKSKNDGDDNNVDTKSINKQQNEGEIDHNDEDKDEDENKIGNVHVNKKEEEKEKKQLKNNIDNKNVNNDNSEKSSGIVFVKKWVKTNHSMLFRFNNKNVQINFSDGTQLLFYSNCQNIMYMDKSKQIMNFTIDEALKTSKKDLKKRIKYTQDVMKHVSSSK